MDKATILNALKTAGLSADLADQIKVTTNEELDTEIKKLKGKPGPMTQEEFDKFVKDNKFFKEALISEGDRRANQAVKTHEEKLQKEKEEADKKAADDKLKLDKERTMNDTDKKLEALATENAELKTMFKEFMGKTQGEKTTSLRKQLLKDAKLPEKFHTKITSDNEDDIKKEIGEISELVSAQVQKETDDKIANLGKPKMSLDSTDNAMEKKIKDYVQKKDGVIGGGLASEQLESINDGVKK